MKWLRGGRGLLVDIEEQAPGTPTKAIIKLLQPEKKIAVVDYESLKKYII